MYKNKLIGVVIPCHNHDEQIGSVIETIPDFIDHIVVVDDSSDNPLPDFNSKRVEVIRTPGNQGVGGATVAGFKKLLEDEPSIIVKMDADGQMDPRYIPDLLDPLIAGRAEYAKGNRFHDFQSIRQIPFMRRIGNLALSFLTKIATGYWNNFDPNNGYFAIRADLLRKIDIDRLHKRYFFETSLISRLYFHRARIRDVAMPAIYLGEPSGLKIWKELFFFPPRLLKIFIRRLVLAYLIYDFNMASLYLLFGIPLFLFGTTYGLIVWITNASRNVFTSTGTIMLVALTVILGFQLILQAIQIDMDKSPRCEDNPF